MAKKRLKRKKYSLSERINYYGRKSNTTISPVSRASCIGYIDGANGSSFDPSIFSTSKEKNAYEKGFEKGHVAKSVSSNIKF